MPLINGTNNPDSLTGTAGVDTINGFGGADTIDGGLGADIINGGLGADLIIIGRGDTVHGNEDDDDLRFTSAENTGITTYAYGDAGSDTLTINFSAAVDSITSYNNNNGTGGIGGLYYYDIESLVITGGGASDTLVGGIGADKLSGGTGNDRLDGGKGANIIAGGAGRDIGLIDVSDSSANNVVNFTANVNLNLLGNKLSQIEGLGLRTGAGKDKVNVSGEAIGSEIFTGGGNDQITHGLGADALNGGTGNDIIVGGRGDTVHGNEDNDALYITLDDNGGATTYFYGDAGNDLLTLDFSAASDGLNSYNNANGTGGIAGVYYYDIESLSIAGGSASDTIVGGIGDDTIAGGGGHDRLYGGKGLNIITGGGGKDFAFIDLSATGGNRTIIFDPAATLSILGNSLSQIEGLGLKAGGGNDTIDVSMEIIASEIDGFEGNDTIIGGAAADALNGGIGNDQITGGRSDTTHGNDGNDSFFFTLEDNAGATTYAYGDAGLDMATLDFSATTDAISSYNNNNGTGGIGGVYYYDMEKLKITGGSASDLLVGGVGDDTLLGGTGNDRIDGGQGANSIVGGAGNDIGLVDVVSDNSNQNINFKPTQALVIGTNTLSQIEGLGVKTGAGDDTINVSKEIIGSEINSGGGEDTITHGVGADVINAGSSADTVLGGRYDTIHGNDGDDTVSFVLTEASGTTYSYGDADQDRLNLNFAASTEAVSSYNNNNGTGGAGGVYYYDTEILNITGSGLIDTLVGGTGNDQLYGGLGGDSLDGRGGSDRYKYGSIDESAPTGSGRDTILTFDNGDQIDLSAIDANGAGGGDPAFVFRGTAAFNGAGQIRYQASGADTLVLISTDADTDAEMAILVIGTHAFVVGDFVP
jgi:Ca2+-binding RTX toxin-like protein